MEQFVYQVKYSAWFAYYREGSRYKNTSKKSYSPVYLCMQGIKEWLRDNSERFFLNVFDFGDQRRPPYRIEAGRIIHRKLMDQIKKKGLKARRTYSVIRVREADQKLHDDAEVIRIPDDLYRGDEHIEIYIRPVAKHLFSL